MAIHLKNIKECATATVLFLCLLVCGTAGNDCSKGVSWKDKTFYRRLRIQGEWLTINCAVDTTETVTLYFGKRMGGTREKPVDNENIKSAKNVFNITNLTTNDSGWYTCEVCGKRRAKFLEVSGQGKAYPKPIVEKKPNKGKYEIGGSVTLSCQVEGTTIPLYDIKWHKQLPNGGFEPIKSEESVVKSILMLTGLSEQDEGTYKCTIHRYPLGYNANALVNINVKEPIKPEIHMINKDNFQVVQGNDFSLPYNVTSYPANSDIQWWRSKDGEKYELIAECSPKSEKCKKHSGKENISNTSLEIKDLRFPQDEYFYKINASNKHGNDSKTFELKVYVKPVISMDRVHVFKQGMVINCTLAKPYPNPRQVNYTWYKCASSKCNNKNLTSESYSLHLNNSPSKTRMNYQCEAKNDAGSAYQNILVVIVQDTVHVTKTACGKKMTEKQTKNQPRTQALSSSSAGSEDQDPGNEVN